MRVLYCAFVYVCFMCSASKGSPSSLEQQIAEARTKEIAYITDFAQRVERDWKSTVSDDLHLYRSLSFLQNVHAGDFKGKTAIEKKAFVVQALGDSVYEGLSTYYRHLLKAENPAIKQIAAMILGRVLFSTDCIEEVKQNVWSRYSDLRLESIRCLTYLGVEGSDDILEAHIRSKTLSDLECKQSLRCLGLAGSSRFVPAAKSLLDDNDSAVALIMSVLIMLEDEDEYPDILANILLGDRVKLAYETDPSDEQQARNDFNKWLLYQLVGHMDRVAKRQEVFLKVRSMCRLPYGNVFKAAAAFLGDLGEEDEYLFLKELNRKRTSQEEKRFLKLVLSNIEQRRARALSESGNGKWPVGVRVPETDQE